MIYPTPVQGAAAVPALISVRCTLANARAECDVLIVARGGGSLEDLWAFNDESVARAIHASPMPVVSGIGHEVDFTIADFVADARAPTPFGRGRAGRAGPPGVPRCARAQCRIGSSWRMRRELRAISDPASMQRAARLKLTHPGARLAQQEQRLDDLEQRLLRSDAQRAAGGSQPRERGARIA